MSFDVAFGQRSEEAHEKAEVGQPTSPNPNRFEGLDRKQSQDDHLVAERYIRVFPNVDKSVERHAKRVEYYGEKFQTHRVNSIAGIDHL